jgi:hypothetical protein
MSRFSAPSPPSHTCSVPAQIMLTYPPHGTSIVHSPRCPVFKDICVLTSRFVERVSIPAFGSIFGATSGGPVSFPSPRGCVRFETNQQAASPPLTDQIHNLAQLLPSTIAPQTQSTWSRLSHLDYPFYFPAPPFPSKSTLFSLPSAV